MLNLLRALAPLVPGSGLRIAAVTRRPELVPVGIEAVPLGTSVQELRMAVTLPRLLRRLRADLGHFQYALPLAVPCPAIVTIHDLSFEREPSLMGRKDRLIFKAVVPRAARKARRVLTVSERTRRDLRELYAIPDAKIVVTPNGVDPVFTPGNNIGGQDYVLFVGAVQERKNPLAALAAAESAGLPLVIVGPAKDEALARELERRGARIAGYVAEDELVELYRGAACLVQPSRFEGFGLPVLEAMACGTPVVAVPEPALQEVAGDAAVWADEDELGAGIRRAVADRERLVAAGLERARLFSWPETARRTLEVYREALLGPLKVSAIVVSHGHAAELERSLPALASQVDDLLVIANVPGSVGAVPEGVRVLENERPLSFAANVNVGITATTGEYVLVANPDAYPEEGAIAELVRFADAHPKAGLVGPLVLWPDGTWQPSLRRFPTVLGTIWRRTPLRLLRRPYDHQVSHYGTKPSEPVQGDWLLGGACLLMRRWMLEQLGGWDGGYRHYVEDIDVAYRAAQAGWERWLVPDAVVRHDYAAVIDKRFLSRHTLWHAARNAALPPEAPRAAAGAPLALT